MRCSLIFITIFILWRPISGAAQDSSVNFEKKAVTLKEVVVRSNLNVPAFIQRVKDDTTFHKAFLNLKVLGYTSLNDIRMLDKKGNQKATLISKTRQEVGNSCRWMHVLEEKTTGNIYDKKHQYNYYTAQLYSSIFFRVRYGVWRNKHCCGTSMI